MTQPVTINITTAPAPPAQCGRTFPHLRHDTDDATGECAGLDFTQVALSRDLSERYEGDLLTRLRSLGDTYGPLGVARAAAAVAYRAAQDETLTEAEYREQYAPEPPANQAPTPEPEDPWALPVPYDVLEQGLRVLEERCGGTCENTHEGPLGTCFEYGRTADSPHGATRACVPCIAYYVLRGLPLPSGDPEATHRAVIEDAQAGVMLVIAAGPRDYCARRLSEHLAADPIADYHRGAIVEVIDGGC